MTVQPGSDGEWSVPRHGGTTVLLCTWTGSVKELQALDCEALASRPLHYKDTRVLGLVDIGGSLLSTRSCSELSTGGLGPERQDPSQASLRLVSGFTSHLACCNQPARSMHDPIRDAATRQHDQILESLTDRHGEIPWHRLRSASRRRRSGEVALVTWWHCLWCLRPRQDCE
jgi:hypothetical protein